MALPGHTHYRFGKLNLFFSNDVPFGFYILIGKYLDWCGFFFLNSNQRRNLIHVGRRFPFLQTLSVNVP